MQNGIFDILLVTRLSLEVLGDLQDMPTSIRPSELSYSPRESFHPVDQSKHLVASPSFGKTQPSIADSVNF